MEIRPNIGDHEEQGMRLYFFSNEWYSEVKHLDV